MKENDNVSFMVTQTARIKPRAKLTCSSRRIGYHAPSFQRRTPMTIQIGERIPDASLSQLQDGVQSLSTRDLFDGRKVLLFSVPGAFTPTCSTKHLPGYIQHFEEFQRRSIHVACMAVNDPFVMSAWAKSQDVPSGLMMLSDGNGAFSQALGLEMDATAFGMGMRSKRFALFADDGVLKILHVESPGEFRVSSAEAMLDAIGD